MKFLAWVLSLIFAFNLGAETGTVQKETDDELRNRVQEHLDTIVDEGAAIVDEISDSVRNDPRVQDAEQFVKDAQEVAEETLKDLNEVVDNAKDRVEEKFGPSDQPAEESPAPAEVQETPAPGETING